MADPRPNCLFVSQETLDQWLTEERVNIDDDKMTLLPANIRFQVETALRFLSEVAGGGDESKLVGKVKVLEEVVSSGGEYAAGTVILGDNAYEVVEGFVAKPLIDELVARAKKSTDISQLISKIEEKKSS